ncbi:MAG TPA: hypothetical protein VLC73_13985, partial [Burkholderiales bacterium]|nr:hypothetical protein [Burkholderiales bacterium]
MKAKDIPTDRAVTIRSDTSVREIALPQSPTKEIHMKSLVLKHSIHTASTLAEFLVRYVMAASIVAAFLATAAPARAQHAGHVVVAQAPVAAKVAEASAAQRDLWVGHSFW